MQADLPKTVNEAVKILAYNDYFWSDGPKTPNTMINPHPKDFDTVSMGMSGDYEKAVVKGSTFLRLGTSIFGERSS